MTSAFINWLEETFCLPIVLAVIPGFIAYEFSRCLLQITWPPGVRSATPAEQAWAFAEHSHAVNVLGALFAATTCLLIFGILVIAEWHYLPTFKDATAVLSNPQLEKTKTFFQYFSVPIVLSIFFWLAFLSNEIIKAVFSSTFLRNAIRIYGLAYVSLSVLGNGGIPVLRMLGYGYSKIVAAIASGPVFVATEISGNSLLEQLLTFVFYFLVLFCVQKYFLKIMYQIYRQSYNQDVFDLEAIKVALDSFIWIMSFLVALSALQINIVGFGIFTGLIGAGLSISFRDLLNNFFSGILLNLDKSVRVHDVIRTSDGTVGEIKKISLRYTFLETRDNIDILVPNSLLVQNRFEEVPEKPTGGEAEFEIHAGSESEHR